MLRKVPSVTYKRGSGDSIVKSQPKSLQQYMSAAPKRGTYKQYAPMKMTPLRTPTKSKNFFTT